MSTTPASSFLGRHEFTLRRLHSLTGLIPVGAFMTVHLAVNSSIQDSPASFQNLVDQIHSLGIALPLVEWVFIFIPILFHGFFGLVILAGGLPNNSSYPYSGNVRYTLQRASALVAFAFIAWHVFHMHGWFHGEPYLSYIRENLNGGQFFAYNASSTAGEALSGPIVSIAYLVGVVACVFHFANGIWTMGITWGAWTSDVAQRRANLICLAVGLVVLMLGVGAWQGFTFKVNSENVNEIREKEYQWYKERVRSGQLKPDEHKLLNSEENHAAVQGAAGDPQN